MNENDLRGLEDWFRVFADRYVHMSPEDRAVLELKIEHTWRVADNMSSLAAEGSLRWADPWLARAIGVLHDTGRFPQYHKHRTFSDSVSINHGSLGATVLGESGILDSLDAGDREILLSSLRYHNAFGLPSLDEERLMYLKLIRDADKLDIWRILVDCYVQSGVECRDVVIQGIARSPGFSADVVNWLGEGRMVPNSMLRNLNDMRLHHVSWAYDINYPASCRMALEAGHLRRIASGLPDHPGVDEAVGRALRMMERRAAHSGTD